MKKSRKESELHTVKLQIKGLWADWISLQASFRIEPLFYVTLFNAEQLINLRFFFVGLESRLKYAQSDRENTAKQIEQTRKEIEKLQHKLENFTPATVEIETKMRERDIKIQTVKERMNRVEDTVFADFCAQIRVANIRQYEERELRYACDCFN